MSQKFILSTESTVDLPNSHFKNRNVEIIFYSYVIDNEIYIDNMERDENALSNFYEMLKLGKMPSTSQINKFQYLEYFDELLQKGDVLHIVFGTGMTTSYYQAIEAQKELKEKYPDRKLVVVDSTCSSSGFGLLVDYACDMRDNGASLEDITIWLEKNKENVHHQFFSTELSYFKRSGRVSGATAMIGTILGICPIMHLNKAGKIISYAKAHGKKKAMKKTLDEMQKHIKDGVNYSGKCYISHSNVLDDAVKMKQMIEANFPNLADKVQIYNIGTIIASHTGEGTVAVFFMGDLREEQ